MATLNFSQASKFISPQLGSLLKDRNENNYRKTSSVGVNTCIQVSKVLTEV